MRLIDVDTLELKEFFSEKAPPYAILSHTWNGDTEVTLQEWERAATDSTVTRKEGYAKIVGACRRARSDGLQYLWCDTNCIDKSSSAELSEAINSMFAWYHDSTVCYAYLYDVQAGMGTFAKSHWLTRGWTLQELLAPSKVLFFDHHWTILGDRSELASAISYTTRIHIGALMDRSTIYDYSIAQRMSWAANRETTRSEDIAYCLLGIFDINMPLLYGEGPKAFPRLQREIIKASNDQSILAWDLRHSKQLVFTGALAPSPAEFRFCGSIVRSDDTQRTAYSLTNLGISIELALIKTYMGGIVLVGLNCSKELYREASHSKLADGVVRLARQFRIWIPLCHVKHNTYVRAHHPSSKLFLAELYPILGHPAPTKLFLSLNTHQTQMTSEYPIRTLQQQHSPDFSSGICIAIAAGKTMPPRHALREAYPLGDTSIVQLKPRRACAASHILVSYDDLSIIFSVFWNEDCLPKEWVHTVIFDPGREVSNQMIHKTRWNCFFEANGHMQSAECCNSIVAIRSLHRSLNHIYGKSVSTYSKEQKDPIVNVESRFLKDSFEQPELIVDVIFRSGPKFKNQM